MTDATFDEGGLRSVLAAVPGWPEAIVNVSVLEGGLTNRSYRITTRSDGDFVVRVPGQQTELLGIDRRAEASITTILAELGIAPPTVCEIPALGTVVSRFVEATASTAEDLNDPAVFTVVVRSIKLMHAVADVAYAFPIFDVIRKHASDAARFGRSHDALPELLLLLDKIESAIAVGEPTTVLCHNDLLPANVLLGADGAVWLIDFEYAGMNAASFDLANLAVNSALGSDSEQLLLTAYFGEVTDGIRARHSLMKIVSELREGLWGLVQSAISASVDVDYALYGARSLAHCKELSAHPQIGEQLKAATRR